MADAAERAADLLTASMADAEKIIAAGEAAGWHPENACELADQMVAAMSGEDARETLAALTAIATLLLVSVAAHTKSAPEDILVAMRMALR